MALRGRIRDLRIVGACRVRSFVILLTALLATSCANIEAPLNPPLVGTWRLVSYVDTPVGGEPIYSFGRDPIGQFVFTPDGHATIIIARNSPSAAPAATDPDPDACVPEWYCSYFGAYRIDDVGGRWIIHVEGGNIPSFIGTDQERPFRIEGDRLTISTEYLDADGRTVRADRVLVRRHAAR